MCWHSVVLFAHEGSRTGDWFSSVRCRCAERLLLLLPLHAVASHAAACFLSPAGTPLQPPPVSITAGAEGATLLVCPSLEAAAALAAEQQQLQPTLSLPAGALASPQALQQGGAAVGLKPSGLSRHSPGHPSRLSPGQGAAGAGGPVGGGGVGHRGAAAANAYSRRGLAAAVAAADLLMEPFPGAVARAGVAPTEAAAAAGSAGPGLPAAAAAAAAAAAGGDAPRGLSRVSPPLARRSQELQQPSRGSDSGGKLPTLARTSSGLPLAGAQFDNAVSLGVDMRAGPLSSLGTGRDTTAAAAAAHASGSLGEGAAAAAGGAGRAARQQQQRQQMRRSKSQRPLKASAGAAVGERRIGGSGGH